MEVRWFRQNKQAVLDELRRGERPLMATTTASGPLDELIALHGELGVFDDLDHLPTDGQRAGVDDSLLFRTLAALPFLPELGLDPSARLLFQDPAVLVQLGWALAQIQAGDNRRHRHPEAEAGRVAPVSSRWDPARGVRGGARPGRRIVAEGVARRLRMAIAMAVPSRLRPGGAASPRRHPSSITAVVRVARVSRRVRRSWPMSMARRAT